MRTINLDIQIEIQIESIIKDANVSNTTYGTH